MYSCHLKLYNKTLKTEYNIWLRNFFWIFLFWMIQKLKFQHYNINNAISYIIFQVLIQSFIIEFRVGLTFLLFLQHKTVTTSLTVLLPRQTILLHKSFINFTRENEIFYLSLSEIRNISNIETLQSLHSSQRG